jgi:hypothetical protein
MKTLDVNRPQSSNYIVHKTKYNTRNRYEDDYFLYQKMNLNYLKNLYCRYSKICYLEYDMMIWCDFTITNE